MAQASKCKTFWGGAYTDHVAHKGSDGLNYGDVFVRSKLRMAVNIVLNNQERFFQTNEDSSAYRGLVILQNHALINRSFSALFALAGKGGDAVGERQQIRRNMVQLRRNSDTAAQFVRGV